MSNINLLKYDGSVDVIDTSRLTQKELSKTKYLLIKNNNENRILSRNFILTIPSKLMIFDRAIIDYQLEVDYDNYEDNEAYSDVKLEPIHVDVYDIVDLLTLINSIDRLNVSNNLLNEDLTSTMRFNVLYMGVTLYKDNTKIYDKFYALKDFNDYYYSWNVAKVFDDIYDGDIANRFIHDKMSIFIKATKSKLFWEESTYTKNNYDAILTPSNMTNIFNLLSYNEYKKIQSIISFDITCLTFCGSLNNHDEIKNMIEDNASIEDIKTMMDDNDVELFNDLTRRFQLAGPTKNLLMDFISNTSFAINSIKLLFDEIYGPSGKSDTTEFNVLISYILNTKHKTRKIISMEKSTIISDADFLSLL